MLSETIRKARLYSGIKQSQMAKELFISDTKYSRKENGKAKIERHEAVKLARILELNEGVILKYWMADKIYALMKMDKDLFYDSLKIVEMYYDNYENCIEAPSKNCSYSSLEERMQRRGRKKKI